MSSYTWTAGLVDTVSLYEVTRTATASGSESETETLLASGLKARLSKVKVKLDEIESFGEIRQKFRDATIQDTAVLTDQGAEYRLLHGSTKYEIDDWHRQRDENGRFHHVSARLRLLKYD